MTTQITTNKPFKTGVAQAKRGLALLVSAVMLCTTTASFADKPEWVDGGKHQGKGNKHQQRDSNDQGDRRERVTQRGDRGDQRDQTRVDIRIGAYFGDQQRSVANGYYTEQYRAGRCPPGLAKKNNGCMPPGQAKKYMIGQPLPRDVVFYPVPATVSVRLGVPPAGYKYVRVATDILLIAVGTSMVVDAMQDLGRL